MRKNTTGQQDSRDYLLGKGIVYFAEHDANGRPLGYRDLGNAPDFAISIESENYEHSSSRSGIGITDLDVPISQDAQASFTLESINYKNMELFLSGASDSLAVGTAAGEAAMTEMQGAGAGEIAGGMWYDIAKLVGSVLTRYTGIVQKSDFVLQLNDGATQVALTEGTDYLLDLEFGRVFLISTAANIIAIAGDDYLEFTLAANGSAPSAIDRLTALSQSSKRGSLRFLSENANSEVGDAGKFSELTIYNVTLTPNGDFNLISDEAAQMQFTAAATPNSYDGRTLDILTNPAA